MYKKLTTFAAMIPIGATMVNGVSPLPPGVVEARCPRAFERQCVAGMPRLPSVPNEPQRSGQVFDITSGTTAYTVSNYIVSK
jgi:hypothetical protein